MELTRTFTYGSDADLAKRRFGIRVAEELKGPDERQLGGSGIMNELVHPANVKYAVIQVSSEADSQGRVVRAYSDEQSLSNLIAGPSIIARGFAHREETAAVVGGNPMKSSATKGTEREHWENASRKCNLRFHPRNRRLTFGLGSWKHRNVAYNAVQFAIASAVLVLYSKNILSSIVRTILGT